MNIQLITLIALVVAIFIGFKRKVNTGLVGIAFAYVVGYYIAGMSAKDIYVSGFPTKLFIILLGMTLLFSIAKVNGTLELIARKVSAMAGGNTKLLPIFFFIMCTVIAAAGPGPIVVPALMLPIAMEVAKEEDISDLLMATIVIAGSLAGGLSPLSPSGIIASNLAAEAGVTNYTPIFLSVILTSTLQAIAFYFAFGGHKLKGRSSKDKMAVQFNKEQLQTLVVILLVIVAILIFKQDIGMTAFLGAAVLLLLSPKVQKDAIANVPWPTLLLISGVAILVNVVKVSGGIDALSTFLAGIMTEHTAPAIMAIMGGLMSSVSSASGVVMPTLIPTVNGIVEQMGGTVTASSLISAIVVGAHVVTYSPLSTLGALAMASSTDRVDKEKFFAKLLALGFGSILFAALLGFIGLFR
jgi:Na+/H+ antiporter NhaD/arsenite permease-like protein